MTPKQIKEKYGIEPIMKEMWVWDEDENHAVLDLVLYKKSDSTEAHCYETFTCGFYNNASETNPNEKEPKVGDKGYFWDDESFYCYDELKSINTIGVTFYQTRLDLDYLNFSHEKQPWMQ